MAHPFWNCVSLMPGEPDSIGANIDQQFTLQNKEELVFPIVLVPVELAFKDAETDQAVIYLTKSLIVPPFLAFGDQAGDVNEFQKTELRIRMDAVFPMLSQFHVSHWHALRLTRLMWNAVVDSTAHRHTR